MKLFFKQRIFSWFDSYDIYDELGNTVFVVKGEPSFGHKLPIYSAGGEYLGMVRERVFTFLPKFELYIKDSRAGTLQKEFTFFKPVFSLDYNGWKVEGDVFGWDYSVTSGGCEIMSVSKQLFRLSDSYVLDIRESSDALICLMIVLAIDAQKCSANN